MNGFHGTALYKTFFRRMARVIMALFITGDKFHDTTGNTYVNSPQGKLAFLADFLATADTNLTTGG